jgi:hypothetical protein
MPQSNLFANHTTMPILVPCVLAIGFMFRFLIAMAAELGKPRARATTATKTKTETLLPLESNRITRHAGPLVLEEMRIIAADSSNVSLLHKKPTVDRDVIRFIARPQTTEFSVERRHERQ